MDACFLCESEEEKELRKIDNEIEKRISKGRKEMRRQIKVLFLGTGEAGKSTIVKQMKIIHEQNGFSDRERMDYIRHIHSNLVESIQQLVGAMDILRISFQDHSNKHLYDTLLRDIDYVHLHQHLDAERMRAIRSLWLDEGVREAFAHRKDFHLSDSTEYFMERITSRPPTPPPLDLDTSKVKGTVKVAVGPHPDTPVKLPLIDPKYIPRNSDIVRVRVRTCKIEEYSFKVGRAEFLLVDVGGQNTERRKWIHCFENVTLIMFIASLSEYDQTMFENPGVNRMRESLALFDVILNYKDNGRDSFGIWFHDAPVVLFLNKTDLFEEKILISHLNREFPDYVYTGVRSVAEEAKEYILLKYLNTRRAGREVFTHFTTATDTRQMEFIFNVGRHSILQRALMDFNPF